MGAGGSCIRHSGAAPFHVVPLPVPVIVPSFGAVLVFLVRLPMLLQLGFVPADIPAVGLPPPAGMADVEHRPAPRPAAKHCDPPHLSGQRIPRAVRWPHGNRWVRAAMPGVSICNQGERENRRNGWGGSRSGEPISGFLPARTGRAGPGRVAVQPGAPRRMRV